jgi:hypothetical protein
LGVAANKNGRECWCTKKTRFKFTKIILEHDQTRTKPQTDLIVQQLQNQRHLVSNAALKEKMTLCGIRLTKDPFENLQIDAHIQVFPDIDHLLDLGILKRILDYIVGNLEAKQIASIEKRYQDLELPLGWNRIYLNLKSTSKKMKPMTYNRKLAVLAVYLFRGFMNKTIEELLIGLLKLRSSLLASFQTDQSVSEVSFFPAFVQIVLIFLVFLCCNIK